jgi:Flp pilus assembly pilin Flp
MVVSIVKIAKMRNQQRGAAAVELAVILPFLVVLVFGMIEFGVMFYDKAVITNASREGVRAGITGVGVSQIKQIVSNYCDVNLINLGGNNAVDPNKIFITPVGSDLVVRIEYSYDLLFASIFGFPQTTISAETVMRME